MKLHINDPLNEQRNIRIKYTIQLGTEDEL